MAYVSAPTITLASSHSRLSWRHILSLAGDDDPVAGRLRVEQLTELNGAMPVMALLFTGCAATLTYDLQGTMFARAALIWFAVHTLLIGWAGIAGRRNARVAAGPRRTAARMRRVAVGAAVFALLWNGLLLAVLFTHPDPKLIPSVIGIELIMIGAGALSLAVAPLPALAYSGIFVAARVLILIVAISTGYSGPPVLALVVIMGVAIVRGIWRSAQSLARQVCSGEALRERGEVIRLLLNDYEQNSSDWLWEVDMLGRLTHVPPRFASLLGREAESLIGERLSRALGPLAQAAVAEALAVGRPFRDLVVPIEIAGELRWWSLSASLTLDHDGAASGFRGVGADVTDAKRNQEQIARMASSDGLTGLANRAALREHIQSALESARRLGGQCAVMLIDLDRFKSVNDMLGHQVGDELLREVARRLRRELGDRGEIARVGGDEFAVVMPGVAAAAAHAFATKWVDALSAIYAIKANPIRVGASIGIAIGPEDGDTIDELMRAADLALYRAKSDGRGVARLYEPAFTQNAAERREMEFALRAALRENQLSLMFQPIVDIPSGGVVGFEALLRWTHPVLGQVSPVKFIPVAEELGLMDTIGEWVIRSACEWAGQWPRHIGISVNLSPSQLIGGRLPGIVLHALAANSVAPDRLELEVTENIFLNEDGQTRGALAQLAALGVRIGLDAFGTGYSSLGYLRNTVFNTIKIDRCFVREAVDSTSQSAAIVRHIVGLAASLGMDTVAEGAETIEELNAVRELGCGRVQGYFTGRPMLAEAATALVGEEREARAA